MIKPTWFPTDEIIENSNIKFMMTKLNFNCYNDFYIHSIHQPERFWDNCINCVGIQFNHPYSHVFKYIDDRDNNNNNNDDRDNDTDDNHDMNNSDDTCRKSIGMLCIHRQHHYHHHHHHHHHHRYFNHHHHHHHYHRHHHYHHNYDVGLRDVKYLNGARFNIASSCFTKRGKLNHYVVYSNFKCRN
jgi:hypothetical protein